MPAFPMQRVSNVDDIFFKHEDLRVYRSTMLSVSAYKKIIC